MRVSRASQNAGTTAAKAKLFVDAASVPATASGRDGGGCDGTSGESPCECIIQLATCLSLSVAFWLILSLLWSLVVSICAGDAATTDAAAWVPADDAAWLSASATDHAPSAATVTSAFWRGALWADGDFQVYHV